MPKVIRARYVRIVCNGASTSTWNSITEVRIRLDESQGLDIVQRKEEHGANRGYFDLSGHRIAHPSRKGIYVVGGKKIVVK